MIRSHRSAFAATLVLFALVLTGCGSSGTAGSAAGGSAASPSVTETTAAPTTHEDPADFASVCGKSDPKPTRLASVDLDTAEQVRVCIYDTPGKAKTWIDQSGVALQALRNAKDDSEESCTADLASPVGFIVVNAEGSSRLSINAAGCWSVLEPHAEKWFTAADEAKLKADFAAHYDFD